MTQSRLSMVAARTLTAELDRHLGPKTGLLVGASAESAVLDAALDALLPDDRLAVVGTSGRATGELRSYIEAQGQWVTERVRVLDSLAEAERADVVMVAEPVLGTAEDARTRLDELAKLLNPGGVVAVPAMAVPGQPDDAAAELSRQAVLFGVGSDLVLRTWPPLRVHRLRFTAGDVDTAEALRPAHRPSSVAVTHSMHIDSNGVAAAGLALGLAALTKIARRRSRWWLVPALAAAPIAAFFRDPQREVPTDDQSVVAASDGTVLSVERVRDERFADEELLRIAVFLSVLDVHVNRSPVAGRVVDYFITDGGYAAAMRPAAEHNVAAYTVLETVRGTVVVAQRTGLVARRIVQRAPVGAMLAKGERFGLIRFGSRTDVYLPAARAESLIGVGDHVRGGSTVIARWID
jgi:phosphatidylserine decarboxylase